MTGLLGTLLGGTIALISTIVVDRLRERRELRHRWDQRGFDELRDYISSANLVIGALYDRGHTKAKRGPDSESFRRFKNVSRGRYDELRVAEACAAMSNPALRPEIDAVGSGLEKLKVIAERGFEPQDAAWEEGRAETMSALRSLIDRAGDFYGMRSGDD
ncbi:hypothetical protein [Ilumatobacter sp.]|uniref:hypothetical protein n=1 Tax=Ilumatobacter sp. TaxID=1967498 RepID=UPI003B525CCB